MIKKRDLFGFTVLEVQEHSTRIFSVAGEGLILPEPMVENKRASEWMQRQSTMGTLLLTTLPELTSAVLFMRAYPITQATPSRPDLPRLTH